MNGPKDIPELFRDPVLSDYFERNDRAIRYAVSIISAECESLSETSAYRGDPEAARGLENIISMCCRLMSISQLYTLLSRVGSSESESRTAVELEGFVTDFVNGCKETLGETCELKVGSSEKVYIDTTKHILIYVLLGFVRSAIIHGAKELSVSCGRRDGAATITIDVLRTGEAKNEMPEEFRDRYSENLISIFTEQLGCGHELKDDRLQLILPMHTDGDISLRSPVKEFGPELFSDYNIMLSDLGEKPLT